MTNSELPEIKVQAITESREIGPQEIPDGEYEGHLTIEGQKVRFTAFNCIYTLTVEGESLCHGERPSYSILVAGNVITIRRSP